jgi:selenoprotein W-related protein
LGDLKQKIKSLTLVPAGGGCFEVTVDGELIYSKLKTGKFPDEQSVLNDVRERLKK